MAVTGMALWFAFSSPVPMVSDAQRTDMRHIDEDGRPLLQHIDSVPLHTDNVACSATQGWNCESMPLSDQSEP